MDSELAVAEHLLLDLARLYPLKLIR